MNISDLRLLKRLTGHTDNVILKDALHTAVYEEVHHTMDSVVSKFSEVPKSIHEDLVNMLTITAADMVWKATHDENSDEKNSYDI